MADYKYLIVGQGLAGTVLSYQLYTAGIPHKVIDNGHRSAATLAAAGLINPITGRRYVKSWMIEELLPKAIETYSGLEQLLDIELLHQSDIIRTFDNLTQENLWNESTSRPGYEAYTTYAPNPYASYSKTTYGYGVIKQAYQVKVGKMILAYRDFLINRGLLISQQLKHNEIQYDAVIPSLAGHTFDAIIYNEGYKVIENPLFKDLPFQPAKGESLIIKTDHQLPKALLRDTVFIAPLSDFTFWSGGGYVWDKLNEEPTLEFLDSWIEKLESIWSGHLEVISHKAGVRPSVKGRRPLIGRHPVYPRMILFNGMGTKGTSLAPYWAQQLIAHLETGKKLSDEVDLTRFLIK